MKRLFTILVLISLSAGVFAQKTYVWKGGKPGRANDWHCPANWSTYRVPDEFADVIIPHNLNGTDTYPVIKMSGCEINTLRIAEGARVTLEAQGSLTILYPDFCDDLSRMVVYGTLILPGLPERNGESSLASRQF